jgi:putative membrane protein
LLALAPDVPRDVGLLLIAAGVGAIALFTWQYLRAVRHLLDGPFAAIAILPRIPLHQLSCLAAYAIMLIGALAFASVLVSF